MHHPHVDRGTPTRNPPHCRVLNAFSTVPDECERQGSLQEVVPEPAIVFNVCEHGFIGIARHDHVERFSKSPGIRRHLRARADQLQGRFPRSELERAHREHCASAVMRIVESGCGDRAASPPKGAWCPNLVWVEREGECRRTEEEHEERAGRRGRHLDWQGRVVCRRDERGVYAGVEEEEEREEAEVRNVSTAVKSKPGLVLCPLPSTFHYVSTNK